MSASLLIQQLESSSRQEIKYVDRSIIQRHCAELLTALEHTNRVEQGLKQGFTVRNTLNGMHSENFLKTKNFTKKDCEILQKTIDQLDPSEALFAKQVIEEYRGVNNLTNW